jgi:hypothetical protein
MHNAHAMSVIRAASLACAILAGGCSGPSVRVEIRQVSGFSDNVPVWMPMRVTLALTNTGRSPVVVTTVHVDPDFDGFNEAYGMGTPHDLETPIRIEPGASVTHEAVITLLNAQQLQPGLHDLTFRVRLKTADENEIAADFPARFQQALQPDKRDLNLQPADF